VQARHAGVLAVAAAGVLAVASPAVAGPVVAGPVVAGPVVAGPVVAGPVVAGPVVADVSVSPASAAQGSGANLTFRVTNTSRSAITRVKLVLPPDSPVAEVYPLSVDDWAPQITQQKLTQPLTTIHGGVPVTVTAKDITWIAMPGKDIAPGRYADLSIALGPLPALSQMRFTVEPTYAGGAAGPAMSPVVLALTPATAGTAPGHTGHGGAAAGGGSDSEDAAFAAIVAQAEQGPSWWSILGWIVAALAGIGAVVAVVAVVRARRRPAPDDDPNANPDTDPAATNPDGVAADDVAARGVATEKEPAAAGTGAKVRPSAWRYHGDP
jgi:hypothetical protein